MRAISQPSILFMSFLLALGISASVALPANASDVTLTSQPSSYMELVAKVEYLKAYIAALEDGKRSPAPTFVTSLRRQVVDITGTVARDPNSVSMEVCGPTTKGTVDWGDGFSEPLLGLGCSGDVYTFALFHQYSESGSYHITVTDAQGREHTRTVAVLLSDEGTYGRLTIDTDKQLVTARGYVALDEDLPKQCQTKELGVVAWGDGHSDLLTTDCTSSRFSKEHQFGTPGTYMVSVRDLDGDVMQEMITIE